MDFSDTPEEAAFRAEARVWLRENPPMNATRASGEHALMHLVADAKVWQRKKFEAGYAAITWPRQFGGREGSAIEALIYAQEEALHRPPPGDIFGLGLNICLPAVRAKGSDQQRERYLKPALRGEEIWCQLFSEPAAGSDLAGLLTKAERDGEAWVVNGQKIWTSGAHYSDFGLLLARTDPSVPKHKGLTAFILDMRAPGVLVRPVRQLNGRTEFNEVFFTNVRIADANRVGGVGEGWQVALAALMHERNWVGTDLGFVDHTHIMQLAKETALCGARAVSDARVREQIADMYIIERALKLVGLRVQTALSKGQAPGPELSIGKILCASQGQQAGYLGMDLLGLADAKGVDARRRVEWSWAGGAAMRIAGGTDEILRNVIAERVLGLPQDVRLDKGAAFSEAQRA